MMNKKTLIAPDIDGLIRRCQSYPEVKSESNIKLLFLLFEKMCCIQQQGDDDYRAIWIWAERGKIEDFGDFNEYLEEGEVNSYEEFVELWQYYYPEQQKWYHFAVNKYAGVLYFYIDSKLTIQFDSKAIEEKADYPIHGELIEYLFQSINVNISLILKDVDSYNEYIEANLPYRKRIGRILRSNYWSIFPEEKQPFSEIITQEALDALEKIKQQSESKTFKPLPTLSAGEFFKYCELGYDANNYFANSKEQLTAKNKYIAMADGRDCGLRNLDENSYEEFALWFKSGSNCGGHPWEICRGGNSTHISLYVCNDGNGWYLRLQGSSRARVIETIRMALVFYKLKVPFVLEKASEIFRMASGIDFIGIVPETVTPRYCNSLFPKEDMIIDFMNLDKESCNEIIAKTYWYPLEKVVIS